MGRCLVQLALLLERNAEIVVRLGELRIEGERAPEMDNGFFPATEGAKHQSQTVVECRHPIVEGDRLADQVGRHVALAGLVGDDAKTMETIAMILIDCEDLPVAALGFCQLAGLMMPLPGGQQLGDPRRPGNGRAARRRSGGLPQFGCHSSLFPVHAKDPILHRRMIATLRRRGNGLTGTATRVALGTNSRKSPSRFADSAPQIAAGRARPATRPSFTGSWLTTKTTGIVVIAALATDIAPDVFRHPGTMTLDWQIQTLNAD